VTGVILDIDAQMGRVERPEHGTVHRIIGRHEPLANRTSISLVQTGRAWAVT
jgi:hypothetical protein